MKRIILIGVCLLAMWLCVLGACPVSAETADATRTFTWNGRVLQSEDQTAAFWEYPQLQAGQTRRDGGLVLVNPGFGAVTVNLSDVQLPYDDEAALTYLGALHLTVRDGDRVLYEGAFSRLNEDGLTEPVTVKGGETRRLSIDLSCDFAYEGAVTCGEQVIYWNWTASASLLGWFQPVLDTWMYWAPALLLIVLIVVWRLRRHRPALPTATERADTASADTANLPPDLSLPAPRGPVTIQLDDPPRRHKAAHAAPRHAKKK